MKPTRPLALIKNIFDSYHQPLPLDKKDKKKLYKLITSSFRKQLDRELGLSAEQPQDSEQIEAAKSFESTSNLTSSSATEAPFGRGPLGSQHLRSILSNPLFSYNASKTQGLRLQGEKDPMDIFEEAVAKGLMTPLRAAGCLKAKRRQIMQSAAMNPVEVMASSSAGHRVVEWLRSSGLEKDLGFIGEGQPLLGQLMPFLVAERMEKTVWVWLDMLSKDGNELSKQDREVQRVLLFEAFVESKYTGAASLNHAYACIAQAKESFPWAREERPPKYIMSTWQKVTWESTVLAWKHLSKASPKLFELFYSIGRDNLERQKLQTKNFKPRHGVELAHLALHHPTKPNAEEALKLLLNDNSIWKNWEKQHEKTQDSRSSPGSGTIRLRAFGLDTIKVCAQQGQTAEAESLLHKMAPYLGQDFRVPTDDAEYDEDSMDIFPSAAVR